MRREAVAICNVRKRIMGQAFVLFRNEAGEFGLLALGMGFSTVVFQLLKQCGRADGN